MSKHIIVKPKEYQKALIVDQVDIGGKNKYGVDGMSVEYLQEFLLTHQSDLVREILADNYLPNAIRGVEVPKTKGKKRLLGIPTVVDRWLQQAVS